MRYTFAIHWDTIRVCEKLGYITHLLNCETLCYLLEPGEELCARLDSDAFPLLLRGIVVLLPRLKYQRWKLVPWVIFNIDFATGLSGVTIAIFPMILWDRDNFFVIIQIIRCVSHHLLQVPGSHLRWQYHCRKAFRKWRAGACSDAPVWRRSH